jgi:RNA polymerase primary sigma factor
VIARAKKAPRIPGLDRRERATGLSRRRHRSGLSTPKGKDAEAAARRAALKARREELFAREIEYIPCRQFLKADAEALATTPPADAAVPLENRDGPPADAKGLSPYLASLYQTRLLTKDEEQFYFRRMNWLKFRASATRGRLDRRRATRKQIEQIEGWLHEAETVKAVIITSNLRLVVSIAKKFVDPSYSFDELVSEGNVALMRAVEKFNFALGNRFSTYATYAIQRHFFRLSHRGRQFRMRFVPDDEALRDRAAAEPNGESCSAEQIGMLKELFAGFLGDLEPRERKIVVARFGFDGQPPRTFRELGSQMGVCKERIRQIQSRAMEKLRGMAAEARLEQTVGDWL